MIGLIRKIILAACDQNHDCTGDTKRETNLKNEMEIVRRMIWLCFSPAESQPV